jgi:hypothetical protein
MKKAGVEPDLFPIFSSLNLAALIGVPFRLVGGIFIDWGDTGVSGSSHEIFGIIAVQHTQGNYRISALGVVLVVALIFAAKSAFSAGITDRGQPDPILSSPADGSRPGPGPTGPHPRHRCRRPPARLRQH